MKYERDPLDLLDEHVNRLKAQYDLFFMGARKLPPMEDRRRLDAQIHEFAKEKFRDSGRRFRFNTIVSRYNQLKELWSRKTRDREEGPRHYRERAAALAAPPAEAPPPAPASVTSRPPDSYVRLSGNGHDADSIQELYSRVVEANRELGVATRMSLEQLTALVSQQAEAIRERYKAPAIAFRIDTSEGKVKLRARPVNE